MGEIRIIGPGKTPGYPYPVCKKLFASPSASFGYIIALLNQTVPF